SLKGGTKSSDLSEIRCFAVCRFLYPERNRITSCYPTKRPEFVSLQVEHKQFIGNGHLVDSSLRGKAECRRHRNITEIAANPVPQQHELRHSKCRTLQETNRDSLLLLGQREGHERRC